MAQYESAFFLFTITIGLSIKLISRDATMKMVVTMEESHLSGKIGFITSVAIRCISKDNEIPRHVVLVITNPTGIQMNLRHW